MTFQKVRRGRGDLRDPWTIPWELLIYYELDFPCCPGFWFLRTACSQEVSGTDISLYSKQEQENNLNVLEKNWRMVAIFLVTISLHNKQKKSLLLFSQYTLFIVVVSSSVPSPSACFLMTSRFSLPVLNSLLNLQYLQVTCWIFPLSSVVS